MKLTFLDELKGIADCCEHEQTEIRLNALIAKANAAPEQEPVAFDWHHWRAGDTVRYTADEDFVHARMTVGSEYLIHESPDEFETMLVLDDDGDELGVLVGEFEFVSRAEPHADPSEVERLRASNDALLSDVLRLQSELGQARQQFEAATQRADAAERKLGEAFKAVEMAKCLYANNVGIGSELEKALALLSAEGDKP